MAETGLLPSPVAMAVEWAKSVPEITAIVGDRISSRLKTGITAMSPDEQREFLPWLRIWHAGGGESATEMPEDVALLQFDAIAYGSLAQPQYDMQTADLLCRTIVRAFRQFEGATPTGGLRAFGGGIIQGVTKIGGPAEVDEPATGWARMRVDSLFYVKEQVT